MDCYSKVANGNIVPMSFVKLDSTSDGHVLQCASGDVPWGIAQQGTRNTPYISLDDGYAAIAGENVGVFGDDQMCTLIVSAAVTPGQKLKPDATGLYGIPVSADGDYYGAIAQQAGAANQQIKVLVKLGQQAS